MRIECPACSGNSYVMLGSGGPVGCGTCSGRGWVSRDVVAELRGCIDLFDTNAASAVEIVTAAPAFVGREEALAHLEEARARARVVLTSLDTARVST